MNEQLRKAIEEATRVTALPIAYHTYVYEVEHRASQAKLLRVIEVLVEQRDSLHAQLTEGLYPPRIKQYEKEMDAKIIAALEKKK